LIFQSFQQLKTLTVLKEPLSPMRGLAILLGQDRKENLIPVNTGRQLDTQNRTAEHN